MQKSFIELKFFETYYYASVVDDIFSDPFAFIRSIHAWYEDNEEAILVPAFPKFTRVHNFTFYAIEKLMYERLSEVDIASAGINSNYEPWIDRALRYHGFPCAGFREWCNENVAHGEELTEDHLHDYHEDEWLSGHLEDLIEHLSKEVFFILFGNRKFLTRFNKYMAVVLQSHFFEIPTGEASKYFKRAGVLKRTTIPMWVKRAVFFRDRGMCVFCHKDLSGLVSAQPNSHFDHIIPLAEGGLNDVTNIQLLCQPCNSRKAANIEPASDVYESWY